MYQSEAFLNAAWNGKLSVLKEELEKGADINSQDRNDGKTALIYATERVDETMVAFLIENHADVNVKDFNGNNALMYLCGPPTIGKLLIDAGADVNTTNTFGYTPLKFYEQQGYQGIVEFLKKVGAK